MATNAPEAVSPPPSLDISIDIDAGVVCGIPVEYGPVPDFLSGATSVGSAVQANEHQAIVRLMSMRLLVENGSRIVIDTDLRTKDEARFALYGWATSLVLLQRGYFMLHASIATRDTVALALTGQSGAGKSTTSLRLARTGWQFSCDDTAPIIIDNGRAWVIPYRRPIHVLPGREPTMSDAVHTLPFREKQAFEIEQDLSPRILTHVVELVGDTQVAGGDGVSLDLRAGPDAMAVIERNVHAWRAARTPGRRQPLMTWMATIANQASVATLYRDPDQETLDRVSDIIDRFVESATTPTTSCP